MVERDGVVWGWDEVLTWSRYLFKNKYPPKK